MLAYLETTEKQISETSGINLYKVYVEEDYRTADGCVHFKPRRIFNIYDRKEVAEAVVEELMDE